MSIQCIIIVPFIYFWSRFSHGYSVCLDDLKEFKDPDYR
jgi:hypothetical protein